MQSVLNVNLSFSRRFQHESWKSSSSCAENKHCCKLFTVTLSHSTLLAAANGEIPSNWRSKSKRRTEVKKWEKISEIHMHIFLEQITLHSRGISIIIMIEFNATTTSKWVNQRLRHIALLVLLLIKLCATKIKFHSRVLWLECMARRRQSNHSNSARLCCWLHSTWKWFHATAVFSFSVVVFRALSLAVVHLNCGHVGQSNSNYPNGTGDIQFFEFIVSFRRQLYFLC